MLHLSLNDIFKMIKVFIYIHTHIYIVCALTADYSPWHVYQLPWEEFNLCPVLQKLCNAIKILIDHRLFANESPRWLLPQSLIVQKRKNLKTNFNFYCVILSGRSLKFSFKENAPFCFWKGELDSDFILK